MANETMYIVRVLDPTAQHRVRYAGDEMVFQIEGAGAVRSFHCSKVWDSGKHYWIPKHAADDRYKIVKMHPMAGYVNLRESIQSDVKRTPSRYVLVAWSFSRFPFSKFRVQENDGSFFGRRSCIIYTNK